MLRKLLIATALLTASGAALAHGDYGRVVSVEPHFALSFGTRHHDGFRVLYESGGARYWTHTAYHPGRVIVLPERHRVRHVHHYDHRDYGYRDDWRGHDDHRGHRKHHHEHRRHGRD